MLILLWGMGSDGPLAAVHQELQRLGVHATVIDQRDVLRTEVDLDVGCGVSGVVRTPHDCIDLGAVTALYLRPYDSRCLPLIAQEGPNAMAWQYALMVDDVLSSWSQITPALVVNPLEAMAANCSKPYQLRQIWGLGFRVPETLVTTDPNAAYSFWQHHGTVIYKSVSAVRSRVSRLQPEHVQRLGDISSCPTQFQQYIAGRDYRVHVVGSEIFACEVICEADDYRYAGSHAVEIRACCLPHDVEERCRQLATAMQLAVAGIDLRQHVDGDWYCFEVNPSPAFTFYQEVTDQPIGRAIARLLAAGLQG
jgi:RimK-like ATP-grasp domain